MGSSKVLCCGFPDSPVVIVAYGCCCWFRARCWPCVGVPRLTGNQVKKSEGKNGLMEWLKVLLWIGVWAGPAWSCRTSVWLCGVACLLMLKSLAVEWILLEAVPCFGRDAAAPEGTVSFPVLVLGAAGASASVAIGVWPVSRWSRTLLMWASCVVVSLSCCKNLSIQHLSLANC